MVVYGDSYLDVPLEEVWDTFKGSGADGLMAVFRNTGYERSNAAFDGHWVTAYCKRATGVHDFSYIDYGLMCLETSVLSECCDDDEPADLADIQERLSEEGRLAGYEAVHRYFEIGSERGIDELEAFLRSTAETSAGGRHPVTATRSASPRVNHGDND